MAVVRSTFTYSNTQNNTMKHNTQNGIYITIEYMNITVRMHNITIKIHNITKRIHDSQN